MEKIEAGKKRTIIWAVTFLLLCVAVGTGWGLLSEKALGAEPSTRAAARPICIVDGEHVECQTAARRKVNQFKDGRLGRASGIRVRAVFRQPAVAKEQWVNKITWKLRHNPRQAAPFREKYAGKVARTCDRCLAYEMYGKMVRDANCTGKGAVSSRARSWACKYATSGPGPELTKQQIQNGGAVILCGGAVAIGVASSTATAGTTSFIALWGAVSCGWSFWMAID